VQAPYIIRTCVESYFVLYNSEAVSCEALA